MYIHILIKFIGNDFLLFANLNFCNLSSRSLEGIYRYHRCVLIFIIKHIIASRRTQLSWPSTVSSWWYQWRRRPIGRRHCQLFLRVRDLPPPSHRDRREPEWQNRKNRLRNKLKIFLTITNHDYFTTRVLPMMLRAPCSCICSSDILTLATPSAPASTFPRSPTWRTAESGPPCSFPNGLKCGPALVQPVVANNLLFCSLNYSLKKKKEFHTIHRNRSERIYFRVK